MIFYKVLFIQSDVAFITHVQKSHKKTTEEFCNTPSSFALYNVWAQTPSWNL